MSKSAEQLKTKICWIPGVNMPADCLTKRLGNSQLLHVVMKHGLYAITESGLQKL